MGIYSQVLLLLGNIWEYTVKCSSYWATHGNIQSIAPPIGQYMGIHSQVLFLLSNTWEYAVTAREGGG
eukprot:5072908-Pyramimonas_sp.AAC.1